LFLCIKVGTLLQPAYEGPWSPHKAVSRPKEMQEQVTFDCLVPKMLFIRRLNLLLYGRVSQGLGTTKFTNVIG